jgi:CRISPR-associated endonuclease/helicase Cas3
LWHDLGKYSIEFQEYLCAQGDPHVGDVAEKVDHSSKGAQHAVAQIPVLGHLLAYVIAGHHSGLLDFHSEGACQFDRLQKALFTTEEAPEKVKRSEESLVALAVVKSAITSGAKNGFATAFFTRMFFSCLVDADFLATERFMSPEQSVHRPDWDGSILQDMRQALERRLEKFGEPKGEVDRHRSAVLWA